MALKFPPPFIEAAHFTPGPRTAVHLVVLHSMESAEKPGTARAVAEWFHDPLRAPQASAHYCVDDREVIQCVREADIAWAAPGANQNGVHIEHAGRAAQSAADWMDEYSIAVLHLSVELCASICRAWSIPAELVDAAGLLIRRRGITTHAEVSRAFKRSSHWDPGPAFPLPWYVGRVAGLLKQGEGL
jgi:N-acetyl-anhydromuramyl-L-alanine amidase AmpD